MREPILIDDAKIAELAGGLKARAAKLVGRRLIVGIAGVPGSGKSTLARKLVDAAGVSGGLVPMDGFHLANRRLEQLGLRDRKGSPPTYDARAYIELLRRARDVSQAVRFPVYDRKLHEPVLTDGPESLIPSGARLIVTEGNYLLLDKPPWNELPAVLDACWFLETPPEAAKRWIVARHERGGRDAQDALRHFERNDAPNTELVLRSMRPPELRLRWKA